MNFIDQIFVFCRSYALRLIAITMLFVGPAVPLWAQTTLPLGGIWKTGALTNGDLLIPEGAGSLQLTLKGGDGGDAHLKGANCDRRVKGGAGAVISAAFAVGSGADQLKPGGRLRVFVGMTGHTNNKLCSPMPSGVYAGGGGSSAVLYQAPGLDPVSGTWDLLMVAGAGGGGSRPSAGIFNKGKGGNVSPVGDASYWDGKGANREAYNGDCGVCIDGGVGGAGVACQTYDIRFSGGGRNMTLKLIDKEAATQIVLKPNSEASKTGGDYSEGIAGGNGFTGGGGNSFAPGGGGGGGGGGYSGGGACSVRQGGGGSSFVSSKFPPLYTEQSDGQDGGGSESNGYVTIIASSPDPLSTQLLPGGGAYDVAIGNDGSIWKLSNEHTTGGYKIYKYNGSKWELKKGSGTRIAVAPNGIPWLVNEQGNIFRAADANASSWIQLPGSAHDIAVDNNGYAWVIGTIPVVGGYSIHFWTGSKWNLIQGAAVRIGAGTVPWVVNSSGQIYRWNYGDWQFVSGWGRDIGVSKDGQAYLVGKSDMIYRRISSLWVPTEVKGSAISAGNTAIATFQSQVYKFILP